MKVVKRKKMKMKKKAYENLVLAPAVAQFYEIWLQVFLCAVVISISNSSSLHSSDHSFTFSEPEIFVFFGNKFFAERIKMIHNFKKLKFF